MRSVMCISYCLYDWQTIFIILFSSFWSVDREIGWDDDDKEDVRFVLDQHTYLDFIVLAHWNSLWVTSFTNIILILSQTVFALTH